MQKKPGAERTLRALRHGLLLAVSIAALSGCVSAVSTDMRAESAAVAVDDQEEVAAQGGENAAKNVATVAAEADETTLAAVEPAQETGADRAGLVLQPTALNAGATSIYATAGQAATGIVAADAAQVSGRNATLTSIYAGAAAGEGRLPVEDMPVPDLSAEQPLPLAGEDQSAAVPEMIPLAQTEHLALVGETGGASAAQKALAASLFAAEAPAGIDGGEAGAQVARRTLNRDDARALRTASLGTGGFAEVLATAVPEPEAHSEAEDGLDDEAPAFTEVASLAGLARLAPNGLWLQTEKVKTGCFKPELLDVLHKVEDHYGKPIIVTSGLRGVKRNRAKQSLHTRCEAADIQIAGVGKWELADYLRSLPGRGGVGTYCHTESVHIDIGPARDWNWRCRRRK